MLSRSPDSGVTVDGVRYGPIDAGLDAVKGVGYAAVEAIKRAREEDGPFTSLWDFCERVDCRAVNKKAIEALIKCGAFGSTGASRRGMLDVLEETECTRLLGVRDVGHVRDRRGGNAGGRQALVPLRRLRLAQAG